MARHLLRLLTGLGLVALAGTVSLPAAHASTGTEGTTGAPTISVTVDTLTPDGLHGTVSCSRALPAWIDVEVSQQVDHLPPVTGSGAAFASDCGPEPTSFTAELRGNGVLLDGAVEHRVLVGAWDSQTRQRVEVATEATVVVTGTVDLGAPPPDWGPLAVTFDGTMQRSPDGVVVTGTVTCAAPEDLELSLAGTQRLGRYHAAFATTPVDLRCDGETPFAIPASPHFHWIFIQEAQVTLRALSTTTWEETRRSTTVALPARVK